MAAAAVQVGTRRDTKNTTGLGGGWRRNEGRVAGWAWLGRWIVWDSVGRWPTSTFQPPPLGCRRTGSKAECGVWLEVERILRGRRVGRRS
jgi:hypothetical protein